MGLLDLMYGRDRAPRSRSQSRPPGPPLTPTVPRGQDQQMPAPFIEEVRRSPREPVASWNTEEIEAARRRVQDLETELARMNRDPRWREQWNARFRQGQWANFESLDRVLQDLMDMVRDALAKEDLARVRKHCHSALALACGGWWHPREGWSWPI
jgi:hypothetical protein